MARLERTMNSEHEELAARYADECARTLLAYYQAEQDDLMAHGIQACWSDHKAAVERYEQTFPKLDDWEKLAEPALMRAIVENRP